MRSAVAAFASLLLVLTPAAAGSQSESAPEAGTDSGVEAERGEHAVILLYHHVSRDTPPSTSVSPERFEDHLEFLEAGGYRVWPLQRLLAAVYDGAAELPPDVVAITFDDAYESVLGEAHPRLAARGWPYTVFVNTDAVDAGHSPYLGWDELRRLADAGVAIENHSAAHGHMAAPRGDESRAEWEARVDADLARAHRRISEEVGSSPEVFAYPYGEDSPALAGRVGDDYRFALVQRSGAIGPGTDPLAIPRFPMATGFSTIERLELAVRSRPLPVEETETRAVGDRGDIRWIRLRLDADGFRLDSLGCFSGSGDRLPVEIRSSDPIVVGIDVADVGRAGRNKVNCTAPAADGSGDFYWYSFQWLVRS